jgi:transcriptional regulator with XRE-family HTH domain
MANTNTEWISMTDANIIKVIGQFIRQKRLQTNKTQSQLAEEAGLNPYTISQIENGVSVTLSTLIQLLRALDALYVLDNFSIAEEISPIMYAKMQKNKRQRARSKPDNKTSNDDTGW